MAVSVPSSPDTATKSKGPERRRAWYLDQVPCGAIQEGNTEPPLDEHTFECMDLSGKLRVLLGPLNSKKGSRTQWPDSWSAIRNMSLSDQNEWVKAIGQIVPSGSSDDAIPTLVYAPEQARILWRNVGDIKKSVEGKESKIAAGVDMYLNMGGKVKSSNPHFKVKTDYTAAPRRISAGSAMDGLTEASESAAPDSPGLGMLESPIHMPDEDSVMNASPPIKEDFLAAKLVGGTSKATPSQSSPPIESMFGCNPAIKESTQGPGSKEPDLASSHFSVASSSSSAVPSIMKQGPTSLKDLKKRKEPEVPLPSFKKRASLKDGARKMMTIDMTKLQAKEPTTKSRRETMQNPRGPKTPSAPKTSSLGHDLPSNSAGRGSRGRPSSAAAMWPPGTTSGLAAGAQGMPLGSGTSTGQYMPSAMAMNPWSVPQEGVLGSNPSQFPSFMSPYGLGGNWASALDPSQGGAAQGHEAPSLNQIQMQMQQALMKNLAMGGGPPTQPASPIQQSFFSIPNAEGQASPIPPSTPTSMPHPMLNTPTPNTISSSMLVTQTPTTLSTPMFETPIPKSGTNTSMHHTPAPIMDPTTPTSIAGLNLTPSTTASGSMNPIPINAPPTSTTLDDLHKSISDLDANLLANIQSVLK